MEILFFVLPVWGKIIIRILWKTMACVRFRNGIFGEKLESEGLVVVIIWRCLESQTNPRFGFSERISWDEIKFSIHGKIFLAFLWDFKHGLTIEPGLECLKWLLAGGVIDFEDNFHLLTHLENLFLKLNSD